jgi:ribose transport system ATP-binding protein
VTATAPVAQTVAADEPVLKIRGLSCSFGSTQALQDVDLDLHPGEVVALLGKNGAGKSTLIKILAGVYKRSGGEIWVDGAPWQGATRAGDDKGTIAFVHQDLGLLLPMSVAENIAQVAGYETRRGLISWRAQRRLALEILGRWDFPIDPDVPVASLDPAHQALVAIARALAADARVIVLDEPTAALPRHDVDILFDAVRRLRAGGVGVLYVTHRLAEVSELADRVVILRDGRRVLDTAAAELRHDEMVDTIVGEAVVHHLSEYRSDSTDVILALDDVVGPGVNGVSLAVRRGEIVALVGLAGAGQRAIGQLVAGITRSTSGAMTLHDDPYAPRHRRDALERGIAYLAPSRAQGGFFSFDTAANFWLRRVERRWVGAKRERREAGSVFSDWGVTPSNPTVSLSALSGGNQQRVLLSKWVEDDPVVLVTDEPGAGVDVGARQVLYERLDRAAQAGVPLVLISSDAEEVAQVAHRALVVDDGRIVASLEGDDLTAERITLECVRDSHRDATRKAGS